jgi:hypothetical protein
MRRLFFYWLLTPDYCLLPFSVTAVINFASSTPEGSNHDVISRQILT